MTQHPTELGLIAQGGSEAAGTDILTEVQAALTATKCTDAMHDFFRVGLVRKLRDEVAQLRERVDSLIDDRVTEGLGIKSLHVENGEMNLSITTSGVAEQTVLTMMDGLADMLGDATNYVEFDLRRRGKEPVSVCVRRYAHPTPHELREAAERERDTAQAEVERLRGALDRPAIDANHIDRQRAFSEATFGPGSRLHGVTDHIAKELVEVRDAAPNNLDEWVDVIILAFDGAWRSGADSQQIIDAIKAKQARNEQRKWPDWRTAEPDKAIEHVRESHEGVLWGDQ